MANDIARLNAYYARCAFTEICVRMIIIENYGMRDI